MNCRLDKITCAYKSWRPLMCYCYESEMPFPVGDDTWERKLWRLHCCAVYLKPRSHRVHDTCPLNTGEQ